MKIDHYFSYFALIRGSKNLGRPRGYKVGEGERSGKGGVLGLLLGGERDKNKYKVIKIESEIIKRGGIKRGWEERGQK